MANLLVYNSADLASANATLRPLYDFAASEMSQNRSVQINATGSVLTEYFQIFGSDPSTISEDGVGIPAILGRRLAPITALQGERAESMANFLENYPGPVGTEWLLVAGGKVSEVTEDVTAVHPSWRRAPSHNPYVWMAPEYNVCGP